MTIKMQKILNLRDTYSKIKSQSLPITTTYKISKLFTAVQQEADFYGTQLDAIIAQYGLKDENGNYVLTDNKDGVQIKKEDIPEVEKKLQELWNIDVELPEITFTIQELESVKLSVEEFNNLLPFITE